MLRRYFASLRFKTAIGILIPLAIIISFTSWLRYASYRNALLESLDASASRTRDVLEHRLPVLETEERRSTRPSALTELAQQQGMSALYVVDGEGVVIYATEDVDGAVDADRAADTSLLDLSMEPETSFASRPER